MITNHSEQSWESSRTEFDNCLAHRDENIIDNELSKILLILVVAQRLKLNDEFYVAF